MQLKDKKQLTNKMKYITNLKAYPWIVVALLWVVALLNYMDRQMLSAMRDSMQIDIVELESAVRSSDGYFSLHLRLYEPVCRSHRRSCES